MRTPPCPLSPKYTPKIEVTHHKAQKTSQEVLIETKPKSPPYRGQDNPVFDFDTATLFSRVTSEVDCIAPIDEETPVARALPPLRRGSYSPFLPFADKDSLTVPAFDGTCPNDPRVLGSRKADGRASLGDTRLTVKNTRVRRQSLSLSWGRDKNLGADLLGSPSRRLRPSQSLSIDNVTSDIRAQAVRSPGLLSTKSMWSTSDLNLTPTHKGDFETMSNLGTGSLSNVSGSLGERMHELVRAFSSRTQRCKLRISQPPTPSSTSSCDDKSAFSGQDDPPPPRNIRFGSFIPMGSRTSEAFSDPGQGFVGVGHCRFRLPRFCKKFRFPETMESYSKLYVTWLFVVMMAYVYNSTVIPLRAVFPYQTRENWRFWLIADYLCDVIYLVDITVFKTRLRFTDNGIVETNYHQTKKHYVKKWMFKFDILSMLPLDLFYIWVDNPWLRKYAWLRIPRMLKIQTFWEFYARCDQAAKSSAHAVRIIKTMTYMLYLIHVETCGYYALSEYEGLGSNRWVYNNEGNAYIRCFYLATKTATSIGNNSKPTNTLEYLFMTLYWLSGVFVFALLIGQIRDIVEAAGQVKENYRKKMDSALHYMQSINISDGIQNRARQWFLYNWEQSKTIDERSLVTALPKKLQTDLAINVHFNTLSKVQLFQDCERNLLYDLVLKLKPNLFLPGDYVCRKGEVGKEMYIVSQGHVEVVGGENNEVVLATLSEGSVFGEISLLAMSGRGNRRTADVRSSGYTNVFTLSKMDFEEAMNEYPEAQKLLKKRAKKLLKENAKKMEKKVPKVEAEEIIKTPNETPKLVKTVIQVLKPESETTKKLTSSIKRTSTSSDTYHLQVPGPVPKGHRPHDHARNNMAFDFSDEQIKPSIRTESYDDDSDDDNELLIIERIEQNLPQSDINDNDLGDLLQDEDDDLFQNPSPEPQRDSAARSLEQEFFDSVMSELRAQDVISRDENAAWEDDKFSLPTQDGEVNKGENSESSRTTTEEVRKEKKRRDNREKKKKGGRSGNKDSSTTSSAAWEAKENADGEVDLRSTNGEATKGAPSRKQPGSQTCHQSFSNPSSRESFTSVDLNLTQQQQPPLMAPDPKSNRMGEEVRAVGYSDLSNHPLANLITVGLGGVCDQDLSALSTNTASRVRKVSTVSLPQLPSDVEMTTPTRTHNSDSQVNATHMVNPPASTPMTPIESFSIGECYAGQLNGISSRKVSGDSECKIPPENQITCAVEIHREKTRTPTTLMPMTEQPSLATATTTATSTPRNSPAPTTKSPLPYEMCHMRETIV